MVKGQNSWDLDQFPMVCNYARSSVQHYFLFSKALHCMQKILENSNGLVTVQTCFSNHVRYLTLSATRPRFFTGTQTILPAHRQLIRGKEKMPESWSRGGNYCWMLLLLLVKSVQFQCRTTVKRGEWVVTGQWQNIPTCCIRPPPCQPGQNWSES